MDLAAKIGSAKKDAEEKNRSIYYDIEPSPDQLNPIKPLLLAKVKDFDSNEAMMKEEDLFASFVPRAVSDAVAEYNKKV